ncbi:hypothetical protein AAMO2058_000178800 [Amorphochlora amoebiformis]
MCRLPREVQVYVSPRTEPRETLNPTARNQQLQAARTPQAARVSESKLGSEAEVNREANRNRIIRGLREMLSRFTISEEMYVDLAVIVGREYRTSEDRVQAVKQKLSEWKEAGKLRLRVLPKEDGDGNSPRVLQYDT